MLLDRLLNRLRGEVRVQLTAPYPERVLNLCGERGIALWNICRDSPTELRCSLSRRDYRRLRQSAKKLGCTVTAERRYGAPYFLRRFRKRYVLAAGLLLCVLWLIPGSFFIWDFRVDGNVTVPDEEILRLLQRHGVGLGTFVFSVNSRELRDQILQEAPELVWLTVNVSGCQAQVQVRERIPAPVPEDRRTPCNLIARRDGLVERVHAIAGDKRVLPGSVVQQGQLLISGIEDTDTVGAHLTAGLGEVTARTWYTLRCRIPLTEVHRGKPLRERQELSLIFGTRRVKIYGNGSYSLQNCDKIKKRTQLSLLGMALPVTVERETARCFAPETVTISAEEGRQRGEALLREQLERQVEDYGTVSSAVCTARQEGDVLTVTLTAECREQIGQKSPVYTEFSAETPY